MFFEDGQGRIKAPGRYHVARRFDADTGALPAGFTVGRGEAVDAGVQSAWVPASTGVPTLSITGQASPDSTASGRRRAGIFGAPIDLTKVTAVRLRAVITGGLSVANLIPRLGFGQATGSAAGVILLSQTTGDVAQLFTNAGTSTNRKVPFKWLPTPIRHDLSLWWSPRDGEVLLTVEDDAIIYRNVFPANILAPGVCFPFVSVQSQATGLQAALSVHKLDVDVYYE